MAVPGSSAKESSLSSPKEHSLAAVALGTLSPSIPFPFRLTIPSVLHPGRYTLTLSATYRLATDPSSTPILLSTTVPLSVSVPFEANYDLYPRLHPAPWPSLFDAEGSIQDLAHLDDAPPRGLTQAWRLVARYVSFADENIRVVGTDCDAGVEQSNPGVRVSVVGKDDGLDEDGEGENKGGLVLRPREQAEAAFDVVCQKRMLDDRGPAGMDLGFSIRWQRVGRKGSVSSTTAEAGAKIADEEGKKEGEEEDDEEEEERLPINTTPIPVPQFAVFGTEPRVLATVSYMTPTFPTPSSPASPNKTTDPPLLLLLITLTLENPSSHFLTFGITMDNPPPPPQPSPLPPTGPSSSPAASPASSSSSSTTAESEIATSFAFSGPKTTTLNVLPVSRREKTFRILPLLDGDGNGGRKGGKGRGRRRRRRKGQWLRVGLGVRDKYFQKVLRVVPASEGVRGEGVGGGMGVLVWVPGEGGFVEEEEEEVVEEEVGGEGQKGEGAL